MMYLLFKTVHIASVIVWIGGVLLQAFALSAVQRLPLPPQPDERHLIKAAVRWDSTVTAPAMALAWMCGIAIAVQGRWFPSFWLDMKLLLVISMSALHGYQSGSLRRLSSGSDPSRPSWRHAARTALAGTLIIVSLVVFKPMAGSP